MPELPEVETIANGLSKRITNDVIESVWLADVTNLYKSPPAEIASALDGSRIAAVRRQGKHIVIDLLDGINGTPRAQWIVHLGMTGRLLVTSPECERAKHTHLVAQLRSGRELRFVDPRRFGKTWVHAADFDAGGVEPLEADFATFVALFRALKTPVKSALLNQKLLRGVGNIYADESLFRAGVRPRRRAASLTRAELQRLYDSLRAVLREAIAAGGSSVSDYVDADGEAGFFQLQHRVYGREGEACRACGSAIKRVVVAGRGTHYCPKCQR